jgi:O-antigen/teichoic acid export membrane protein
VRRPRRGSIVGLLGSGHRRVAPPGSIRSRLVGGVGWSLIAVGLTQGATLVATLFMARILGAGGYGEVATVNVTIAMLGVFAGLGLGITATRTVAELRDTDPIRLSRSLALLDRTVLVSGTAASALMILFAEPVATVVLGVPALTGMLRIGAVLLLLNELSGLQVGVLAGFESFRSVAGIALIRAAVTVPAAVVGSLIAGPEGAVVGMIATAGIAVVTGRVLLRRVRAAHGIAAAAPATRQELPILWHVALPAFVATTLIGPVSWIGAAILVNQPDGTAQLGIFNAANQWRTLILLVPNVIAQAALPVMTSLGARGARLGGVLGGASIGSALPAIGIAVVLIVLRDWIMGLYGPDFAGAGDVLAVVALSGIAIAVQNAVGPFLTATGRMWMTAWMNVAWAAVFVGSVLILVPAGGGALGLAIAYLSAHLAYLVWAGGAALLVLRVIARPQPRAKVEPEAT